MKACSVHPSVILWLSVLYYLRPETVFPFALSVLIHELGHYIALCILDKPPLTLHFTFFGAKMDTAPLSYPEELLAAGAGPLFSLITGLFHPLFPRTGHYSLLLGLANLCPLHGLDGWRMLRSALLLLLPEDTAEKVAGVVSNVFAVFGLIFSSFLTGKYHLGFLPIVLAGAFLLRSTKNRLLH